MSQSFDSAPISALLFVRRRGHLIAQLFSFIATFAVVASAHAAIKINDVDPSRVSNVRGLGTTDVTIFGGVAGSCVSNAAASDTTCSSCVQTAGGNAGLKPCNDRRINASLILRITITSDAKDGYPAMVVTPVSGSAGTPVKINPVTLPGLVTKGNPGTIEVRWSDVCAQMSPGTSGGTYSTCELNGTDYALANVTIGMKSVNDSNGFADGDETAAIKIKVVKPPTGQELANTNGNGITYFEVTSGDQKGTLTTLSCTKGSGFPNSQNIRFQWVRVLFEKRTTENTSVWNLINSGSPHTDMQISDTGSCDSGNLDLSPVAFSGGTAFDTNGTGKNVSIENATDTEKKIYDIKVAVVDEARNAYLYTPAANDTDCNGNTQAVGSTGPECHTIRPAAVAGVLANKTNCFIATASYGSPMAGEVDTFRHFRDTYLIPTKLGFEFVRWYYEHGPVYAKFIKQSDSYRAVARGFLWLPLQFAKVSLDYGIIAGLTFLFTTLLAPFALLAWMLKRKRSARTHA